ncbi:cyclic nucleotide-gated cation channel beta-1-like [Notolabrus celidotus]|uniref:cyclic nucleotide-gated cation channel beta-1-like n=1 Tax=Notolabrus celidotus TaxID=1203425 RepID=UPI0014904F0C|nr:cyclic nucleotide-gated cation channel beta-1-like [Notolabrus celidotus]
MLSWVAKVGPQLPEPPPQKLEVQKDEKQGAATNAAPKKVTFQDDCKTETQKSADKSKQDAQPAEGNGPAPGSQAGVLGWISSTIPKPTVSPKLNRANSITKEENTTPRKGMIAWIAQGLEKVVPQPDLKGKEPPPAEQPAEVLPPAAAPEPVMPPPVKEPEPEKPEIKPYPPRMIDWIKQGIEKVVPQPEFPVSSNTDAKEKTETPASTKVKAQDPAAASKPGTDTEKSSKEAEQPKMMGWIVSGIGRILPQPVQRQDTAGDKVKDAVKDEVQKRGKGHEPL